MHVIFEKKKSILHWKKRKFILAIRCVFIIGIWYFTIILLILNLSAEYSFFRLNLLNGVHIFSLQTINLKELHSYHLNHKEIYKGFNECHSWVLFIIIMATSQISRKTKTVCICTSKPNEDEITLHQRGALNYN